jgi:hypothetical protein
VLRAKWLASLAKEQALEKAKIGGRGISDEGRL